VQNSWIGTRAIHLLVVHLGRQARRAFSATSSRPRVYLISEQNRGFRG